MHSLADFLNHGTLPFTGRDAELGRVFEFWRGVYEATELRALLLTGEGGVGKSRLLEHAIGAIVDAGGSVVHVKLYPESTASFMSLVARALRHRDAGQTILAEEPEPKTGPVGAAMRRLARLRPTIFVLEDLHLLGGEALGTLTKLLALIADDAISLLALARPVELEARGVLEPYLIDELTLHGLDPEECARIWKELTGTPTGSDLAGVLHDATAGNPLALKSALRSVLKGSDAARPGAARRAAGSSTAFARTLRRAVGLLAGGMTSHLSPEELKGARRLASLGEVFSREAASIAFGKGDEIIRALQFKGIIATAVAPPDPLSGEGSHEAPLGFTHTLLHRRLIDDSVPDADLLVRVIADEPLYSILPFKLLSERNWEAPLLGLDTVRRAFDRTIAVQIAINHGPEWRQAGHTWSTAVRLVASRLGRWEVTDWERMLIKLIYHKMNLVRREPMEIRERWLDHLTAVTADGTSDEMLKGRLYALFNRELMYDSGKPEITRGLWEEAEGLIGGRPHLKFTFAYTDYVVAACVGAYYNGDKGMMRRIEHRSNELLAADDLPDAVRGTFLRKIRPPLLSLYETEEESNIRIRQVRELESSVDKNDLSVWAFCIDLLVDVAFVRLLHEVCESTIPQMREQGMTDLLAYTVARQSRVLAGTGEELVSIQRRFEWALMEIPAWRREQIESDLVLLLLDAPLLSGRVDIASALVERYSISDRMLRPEQLVLLSLAGSGSVEQLGSEQAGFHGTLLAPLVDILGDMGREPDPIAMETTLRTPILLLGDVLRVNAAMKLAERIIAERSGGTLSVALSEAFRDACANALEWLGAKERGLVAYMRPVFDRGRRYFNPRQISAWQKRMDELENKVREIPGGTGDGRVKLSMLGTIVARMPDGESQRFQGARARMLLGMMVMNAMLKEPLTSAEFCRLAAGGETMEIEAARDVVKTTVHRLREMIGRDAILTDGGTPRLNPDLVEVDILEAEGLLRRSLEALRRSSLMQARGALMEALDISRGEVPFPSLYDDFVEAIREDFENGLRSASIQIARVLMREGSTDDAAEILRRAARAIPGDGEISELLRESLLNSGRRAEAELAKRRSELVDD